MWKSFILFVAVFLFTSLSAFAAVGDQYCSQIGFTHRCVEQTTTDVNYPCVLTDYGRIECKGLDASDQTKYLNTLSVSDVSVAGVSGVPTSFYQVGDVYAFKDVNDKSDGAPESYYTDYTVDSTITFSPEKGRDYYIGFATNNFTTTDFVNGTCDASCSIDETLELTNVHNSTQDRTDLIGEYLFTTDANDTSGFGNNGTVSGAIQVHERFDFDGSNDLIDLGNGTGNVEFCESSFAVSAWVFSKNPSVSGQGIIADRVGGTEGWALRVSVSKLNLNLGDAAQPSFGTINANVWHHTAFSYDNISLFTRIYLDGVEVGTIDNSGKTCEITPLQPLRIGRSNNNFNGSLDEIQLWNRTLSANEIQTIFNNSLYKTQNQTIREATYTSEILDNVVSTNLTNMTFTFTNTTAFTVTTSTGPTVGEMQAFTTCNFIEENVCLIKSNPAILFQYKIVMSTDSNAATPLVNNVTIVAATFTQALVLLKMCDIPVIVGTNCTITTPVLNCSTGFTYDVINLSGIKVVNNASLTVLNENIYFLNFTNTEERNDFVVRLCDDTTREVRVRGGDENLTNVAVAILLIGMTFFVTKFALELNEKHWPMKLGLFGVVIGFGYGIFNLAVKYAESVGADQNVITTLDGLFLGYTYLALLVFGYIVIRLFVWMVGMFRTKPDLVTEQDLEENEKGW